MLKEIRKHVREFNESLSFVTGDFAIRQIFQTSPRDHRQKAPVLIMRIDATAFLFQGMTYKLSSEVRDKLAKRQFGRHYWKLVALDKSNPYRICPSQKTRLSSTFQKTVDALEDSLIEAGHEGKSRRFPTFVSKLLHVSFPNGFPIRDALSLNAMVVVAKKESFSDYLTRSHLGQDYDGVIEFFLQLRRRLQKSYGNDITKELERFDYDSQRLGKDLKVRNTWLRVIDKWLWLKGKKHMQGKRA